jgi:hypothetical protein
MTRCHLALVVLAVVLLSSTPAFSQPLPITPPAQLPSGAGRGTPTHVMSANPFGLLIELFNTEYERRASDTVSVGIGGSTARFDTSDGHERYVNGDVFFRYYPSGRALSGRSFGAKVGLTQVPNQGTFLGIGFDANQSWLLNDHFYFGSGVGLKRLIGTDDEAFDLKYIPTLRLNVGVAF